MHDNQIGKNSKSNKGRGYRETVAANGNIITTALESSLETSPELKMCIIQNERFLLQVLALDNP